MHSDYETVIGLEVHVQLATKTKLFSGAATAFGAAPNAQACAVDMALPGVLPVANTEAIDMAIRLGLALEAEIGATSVFARKNYFYPDLPKGYQISQMELPLVGKGRLSIDLEDGSQKVVGITRAHLEEDAGKSLHEEFQGLSGIDLNRSGTPLIEIVSEPELRSGAEAVAYLKKINALVRYLNISDGDMSQGSMRCDANISVRKRGSSEFGTRCEIKNVNSYRFVEKAIAFEVARQIAIVEDGGSVQQETRLYNSETDQTRPMRSKEEANDYRYFPDPDLLPVVVSSERIEQIKAAMPELPEARRQRYIDQLGLSAYDANLLSGDIDIANYFEAVLAIIPAQAKLAANWILVELNALLNKHNLGIGANAIEPAQLAQLIQRISDGTISGKIAKSLFTQLWEQGGDVDQLIEAGGLKQVSDSSELNKIIDAVIAAHPQQLADYRSGKDRLFGFFVGQVMKQSRGKANPQQVNQLLKTKL